MLLMQFFLAVGIVLALLVFNEFWWRRKQYHSELGRKFIHITVGTFVAVWPFFLTWKQIQLLSVAFLVAVALSRYLHLFRAIHSVTRPTWGEVFFAIAVGATTLITDNKWIYMTALLQMSLADGMAAVIGTRYGKRRHYMVLGHPKSVIGSTTFFVVSILLLAGFAGFGDFPLAPLFMIGLSATLTLIENIGVKGLDNFFVPIVTALALTLVV